jgi:hypothetical protein
MRQCNTIILSIIIHSRDSECEWYRWAIRNSNLFRSALPNQELVEVDHLSINGDEGVLADRAYFERARDFLPTWNVLEFDEYERYLDFSFFSSESDRDFLLLSSL